MTKKILLVDDEEDVLRLVALTLGGNSHYQLLVAGDGAEALSIVRNEMPDLVLLDVMMPKKDGFEVCREIKQDPATAFVKVVMLTALAQDYNRQAGIDAGADYYFTKPFSPTALLNKLDELLELD